MTSIIKSRYLIIAAKIFGPEGGPINTIIDHLLSVVRLLITICLKKTMKDWLELVKLYLVYYREYHAQPQCTLNN